MPVVIEFVIKNNELIMRLIMELKSTYNFLQNYCNDEFINTNRYPRKVRETKGKKKIKKKT